MVTGHGGIKAALNDLDGAQHEYALANQKEMQTVAPLSLAALRCSLLYTGGNHEQARIEAEKAQERPVRSSENFTAFPCATSRTRNYAMNMTKTRREP